MPRIRVTLIPALAAMALLVGACGPRAEAPRDGTSTAAASTTETRTAGAPSASTTASSGSATPAPGEPARAGGTPATNAPQSAPQASAPMLAPGAMPTPRTDRSGFVVALDPGHGGDESGAAAYGVVERDSNLDMALRVGEFLKAAGVKVHYTRTDAGRATGLLTPGGDTRVSTRSDLQTRVSAANRAGADVFVSLHSNGAADTSMRGVEIYYESRREFADANYRLAQLLLDGTLRGLANAGYPSTNRGIHDAACWRNFNGRCVGLFVLSPGGTVTGGGGTGASAPSSTVKEAMSMPAALLETLFVSSPDDATLLKSDAVRTSVARGIADGILRYLGVIA